MTRPKVYVSYRQKISRLVTHNLFSHLPSVRESVDYLWEARTVEGKLLNQGLSSSVDWVKSDCKRDAEAYSVEYPNGYDLVFQLVQEAT